MHNISSEPNVEEYSDVDFVNQFIKFFEENSNRKPSFKEVKTMGTLIAKTFAIAVIEGDSGNKDVKMSSATFHFGVCGKDSEEGEVRVCNIPEEICIPIRNLIVAITKLDQKDFSIEIGENLVSLFLEHRQDFSDPSWETLLEFSAYSCFQYILIHKGSNHAIDYFMAWLIENVSSDMIQSAKNEAIFIVLKELAMPTVADCMGADLNYYLSDIALFDQKIQKKKQSDFN